MFLYRCTIFISILLGFFVLNFFINFLIYKNEKIHVDGPILIAGDSHSKRGINPKIIGNATNISQAGEPYYITFWKLKKFFKDNSIDTLILSFAPHNIGEFNDLKLSKERWSGEMFKRVYPIQDFTKLSGVDIDFFKYYKILWKETGFYPKRSHMNYVGTYFNTKKSNLGDPSKAIESQYFSEGKPLGISMVSVNYLDSILKLCNSYKINAILVSSPVHSSYFRLIPKDVKNRYYALIDSLDREGIQVMDRTHIVYPDSLYLDVHHLNEFGADKFSKELKHILISKN